MLAIKIPGAFAALAFLGACVTPVTLAKAGPFSVPQAYTVQLKQDWSWVPPRPGLASPGFLTIDGPNLDRVVLYGNVAVGEGLMKERRKEDPIPRFRADMSQIELAEFAVASLSKMGLQGAQQTGASPSPFGSLQGVRVEFDGAMDDGLKLKGVAVLAIEGKVLHAVIFLAPAEHYYAKYLPDVEQMIASVHLI